MHILYSSSWCTRKLYNFNYLQELSKWRCFYILYIYKIYIIRGHIKWNYIFTRTTKQLVIIWTQIENQNPNKRQNVMALNYFYEIMLIRFALVSPRQSYLFLCSILSCFAKSILKFGSFLPISSRRFWKAFLNWIIIIWADVLVMFSASNWPIFTFLIILQLFYNQLEELWYWKCEIFRT